MRAPPPTPPPPTRPPVDASGLFLDLIGRLRAVDHFAVGRRVLAVVALGHLSRLPVRQVLLGHVHSRDLTDESHAQVRGLLLDAARLVEDEDTSLGGVFTEVLVPDVFQSRFWEQTALYSAEMLNRLAPAAGSDAFGRWFSERLDQIVVSGPAATEVATPSALSTLMVELADIRPGDRVYDPCCGLGGLLAHAGATHPDLILFGEELHPISWALSTLRLRLLGFDARIERGDALRKPAPPAERVLCDPPLGVYMPAGADFRLDRFKPAAASSRRLDSLFLEKAFNTLTPDGRAVVLVSQSALFRKGHDQEVRSRLIANRAVEGVIALPPGAVSWTSAELALVILDRDRAHRQIRFLDRSAAPQSVPSRGAADLKTLLDDYRDSSDRPWKQRVPFRQFVDDDNLVPRRRIRYEPERPTPRELFGRSEELAEQANARAERINELLRRLAPDAEEP